jgi:aminomethyltransferase
MKKTALYEKHVEAGAKLVPFAGHEMPVSYSGIIDEHNNIRNAIGIFDVSHMGEFEITGEQAADLVQYVTTNDVKKLEPGKIQYSAFTNEEGGIIDDLLVYMISDHKFMLVVNASNIEKDFEWINKFAYKYKANIKDISEDISLMAVQGPKTAEALQSLTNVDLASMKYYTFEVGKFAGIDNVIISATGYTGAGGFELYCKNDDAPVIWDAIMEAGKPFGIKPAGLGCRDSLRLEMGFCLYGNDINEKTTPLAAGLGWITKLNTDFIGKEALVEKKERAGLHYKLVGMEILEKGAIARQHYEIFNAEGDMIGEVTSGTLSPSLNKPIAMGYVKTEYASPGTEVFIKVRNKMAHAKVVKLPFYQNTQT